MEADIPFNKYILQNDIYRMTKQINKPTANKAKRLFINSLYGGFESENTIYYNMHRSVPPRDGLL